MNKLYNIFLDDRLIGTTMLEKADASMGIVFGQIKFIEISSPYYFFKAHCQKNKVGFEDFPNDKIISTRTLSALKIIDSEGREIKGVGNQISGMESGSFELTIEGIPYPFYETEFPHHIKTQ